MSLGYLRLFWFRDMPRLLSRIRDSAEVSFKVLVPSVTGFRFAGGAGPDCEELEARRIVTQGGARPPGRRERQQEE